MDTEVVRSVAVGICLVIVELLDDVDVLTLLLERSGDNLGPILGLALDWRYRSVPKVVGYAETVVPMYRLDNFRSHFRVQRPTFELLVGLLSNCREIALQRELLKDPLPLTVTSSF